MDGLYRTGLLLLSALIVLASVSPYLFDLDAEIALLVSAFNVFLITSAFVLKHFFDQLKAAVIVLYFPMVPLFLFCIFFVLMVFIKPNFRKE